MMSRPALLLLLAIWGAIFLASLAFGPVALCPADLALLVSDQGDPLVRTILLDVRLPRVCAAALAGLALGASGAAMQGLLRNPLAEPGVMGVSSCAALFATACVYFGYAAAAPWLVPIASMAGALFATSLIAVTSLRLRGIASLILLGVALSAVAGAIMALFVNLAPNPFSLTDLLNWTAGSVANRDWGDIAISLPFIGVGCGFIISAQSSLTVLTLGEEAAHGLGVSLRRTRLVIVVGTGLATGGAVALAGMIGFVGLVAPYMVRAAVGHDAGRAIIPSALVGSALLMAADIGIRLFPWGNELHLGTLAALIGAPVFALIAFKMGSIRHG